MEHGHACMIDFEEYKYKAFSQQITISESTNFGFNAADCILFATSTPSAGALTFSEDTRKASSDPSATDAFSSD